MDDEQPQTGMSGSLSVVRAAVVLVVFVAAVAVLVDVGTRPSVSGVPSSADDHRAEHHPDHGRCRGRLDDHHRRGPLDDHDPGARSQGLEEPTTTTTIAPSSVSVVVANATSTNGLAAHYTTVIGAGGWKMGTPADAATTEATSAVYYAAGFQEPAASIATSIGVKPTQVLPAHDRHPRERGHRHRRRRGHRVGPRLHDDHHHLTLPDAGDRRVTPTAGAGRRGRGQLPAPLWRMAAEPAHGALFLDFDGTLAAIVEDPTGARPLPGVPALLAELARPFALVAVVSGRPTAFLAEVLGDPAGVTLAGLYGLERALHGPEHARWAAVIDQVVAEARAEAPAGHLRRAQGAHGDPALAPRAGPQGLGPGLRRAPARPARPVGAPGTRRA